MIYIQAIYGKEFSQRVMNNNFNLISSKVKDNLKTLDKVNGFVIDAISSSFYHIQSIEDIEKDKDKYINILINILKNNEELYATYFAFSDDSFFEVINLEINKSLREQYSFTDESRWLLVYINGKNKTKRILNVYNERLELIKKEEKENSYLATSRPWYIKAQNQSNNLIKSKPYSFKHIDSTGMTYAKRYNKNVTFALDVLLDNLNKTINGLNSMKSMNSFLFAEDQDLIGSTTEDKDLIFQIKNLIDKNSISNEKEHIYEIKSEKYIINFSQLEDDIYKYLISSVSLDDVMEQYSKYFNLIVIFTVLLFLFLLPLIWYFASVIVKPVFRVKA